MAAFHAFRAASRLYTLSSSPLSGLRFASSSTGTHRFSPKYPSSKATTSKFPPRKPTLGKEAPESYLNSSTLSKIVLSRQQALNKRIPLQTPVPKPGSKPGLKPKPKPEPKAVFAAPPYPPRPESRPPPTPPAYKRHREMMKKKFPDGWAPPRTISREAMEILRALHAENPVQYRTPVLANRFKISPEAVSRILKSKWRPSAERISQAIARDNLNRNKWTANKIRMEREEVAKLLKGRLDIAEKARGKDRLTMK